MAKSCVGGLILHQDRTIAGCTEDDEPDGCAGRDALHEGSPIQCLDWWPDGCDYCGVH